MPTMFNQKWKNVQQNDGQIFSKSMKFIIKNFVGTIPVLVTIYKIVSLQRANNTIRRNEMFEASGGVVNFIAVLVPALMGAFYGFKCLFNTDNAIAEWGIGVGSEFMVKLTGTYCGTQGAMYIILLLTSLSGSWALFAFGTIQAALFLVFGYTTVKGKWAEVEGVNATNEGIIVPAILLVFHLYIMFAMGGIIYGK